MRLHATLLGGLLAASQASAALPGAALRIPADSYAVATLRTGVVVEKSGYLDTPEWAPLLERAEELVPAVGPFLRDLNASGIRLQTPWHFFVRGGLAKDDPITLGALFIAEDKEKLAGYVAEMAKPARLAPRKGKNFTAYVSAGSTFGVAHAGRVFALLGVGPNNLDGADPADRVEQTARKLLATPPAELPRPLAQHLAKSADLSLYLNGESIAELLRLNWPPDQWKALLPALGPLLQGKLSARLTAQTGRVVLDIEDPDKPSDNGEENKAGPGLPPAMLDVLPGDAPLLAAISFESDALRAALLDTLNTLLASLPGSDLTTDSPLPGFDASIGQLLEAPSGRFALALGSFHRPPPPPIDPTKPPAQSSTPQTAFLIGAGIDSPFALSQLLAGSNANGSMEKILATNRLHLVKKADSLWLASPEYKREAEHGRALRTLGKQRRELMTKHPVVLDLDVRALSRSIRDTRAANFNLLKILSIADEAERLRLTGDHRSVQVVLKLRDPKANGWQAFGRHLAQEIIDAANEDLFTAISQNRAADVVAAVNAGALLNAPDRFGHSPMHYAAYKGNPSIVEYLIDKGGKPDARGRHDSTPLHSASWGRNRRALEILLEHGGETDARTDEGETPAMTAALRGEKDLLEILLALSADPHATDDHGMGLADLAAAGGHKEVFDMLVKIGVKTKNPLHVAAGLGDFTTIEKLLEEGKSVNARDGFGATPLIIATVAGREDVVEYLLDRKADPTLSANDGYTLMHGAAFSGKKSLIRKALSLGVDVNARYGPDGVTPVDVADEDAPEAIQYLRALGARTAWELGKP